jgi:hypothetical protein
VPEGIVNQPIHGFVFTQLIAESLGSELNSYRTHMLWCVF